MPGVPGAPGAPGCARDPLKSLDPLETLVALESLDALNPLNALDSLSVALRAGLVEVQCLFGLRACCPGLAVDDPQLAGWLEEAL